MPKALHSPWSQASMGGLGHICPVDNGRPLFPEDQAWDKKALCDLVFFGFSCFIHYFVSYSYPCRICRTEASCRCSIGKHAVLVIFILSLGFVFSRSCRIILDNTVICSQREVVQLHGLMCQRAIISSEVKVILDTTERFLKTREYLFTLQVKYLLLQLKQMDYTYPLNHLTIFQNTASSWYFWMWKIHGNGSQC